MIKRLFIVLFQLVWCGLFLFYCFIFFVPFLFFVIVEQIITGTLKYTGDLPFKLIKIFEDGMKYFN